MCNDSHRPRSRRHRATETRGELLWWYLRARCEISRDVNIPTKASSYLLHDGIQYLFDRNESDNSREAPPPLYPAFRAREARVHLSLSRGLHSPFPRRYSSHSVHSSQVMRVSECETLMSARRS